MTLKTRLSVLLISTPVLAFVIVGGLIGDAAARPGDQSIRHLAVFEDVVSLVLNNYVEEVKVDRAMAGAMRGLADGLDPDSAYLTTQEVRQVEAGTPLPDGDVGIELTRQFYLRVIAARDGSPAAKAGLQTGDYVRGIDGKPTRDMSVFEGTRLLRGEPGSKVTLTLIRGNAADPHEVVLVREKVPGVQVSSHLVGGSVGYVRIASFRTGAAAEVRKQVASLTKSGATSLILDVRRTAEGDVDDAVETARLFVKSGTLTTKTGRQASADSKGQSAPASTPAPEAILARAGDGAITLPALILVSNGTSGPAEIFAAALDGNKRADLVGEHTLGRAGVQKLVKLPENRGLWLTYAKYLAPSGESIHGKGLTPDVAVEEPEVDFGVQASDKDPILDAALARLKKAA